MAEILFTIGNQTVRWWDIIDILIVAYLIYRSALLIKGTLRGADTDWSGICVCHHEVL